MQDDPVEDQAEERATPFQAGEPGAVMGRINNVGSGHGFIPRGYFMELSAAAICALWSSAASRTKTNWSETPSSRP